MVFSKAEVAFIKEHLHMDILEEVDDEGLLCVIQDKAFCLEIGMEMGRIPEAVGKQAADMVTKLGMT